MTGSGFVKDQHLRRPSDFQRVYERKVRASDPHLLVYAALRDPEGAPDLRTRIGLSVSRKNGSAVVRNRIKRLLREAFRQVQHELPAGMDLILIPRPGSESHVSDYRLSLKRLTKRLWKRLQEEVS